MLPSPLGGGTASEETVGGKDSLDASPAMITCPQLLPYPDSLRRAGTEGTVVLEFVVEVDGKAVPSSIRVLTSTHEGFESPAIEMIGGCLFQPGKKGDQPVRVLTRMPINFTLPPK
jgi:TonB family protein